MVVGGIMGGWSQRWLTGQLADTGTETFQLSGSGFEHMGQALKG